MFSFDSIYWLNVMHTYRTYIQKTHKQNENSITYYKMNNHTSSWKHPFTWITFINKEVKFNIKHYTRWDMEPYSNWFSLILLSPLLKTWIENQTLQPAVVIIFFLSFSDVLCFVSEWNVKLSKWIYSMHFAYREWWTISNTIFQYAYRTGKSKNKKKNERKTAHELLLF